MPTNLPPRKPPGYGHNHPPSTLQTVLGQIAVLLLLVIGLVVSIEAGAIQAPVEFPELLSP